MCIHYVFHLSIKLHLYNLNNLNQFSAVIGMIKIGPRSWLLHCWITLPLYKGNGT